jgi:sarcosine oxidase, subunit alpha
MDWIISKQKADFIGKRSFTRQDTARKDRKQLVGLLTEDPNEVLPEGAQLTAHVHGHPPIPMIGHVTSSYYSETLGRSIALALVAGGAERMGQQIYAPLPDKTVTCAVTKPVFYDPEGVRLHG